MSFLPSLSRLKSYSACLSVRAVTLDMSYLKQRAEHLEERKHLMTLMVDEVYPVKHIEYSNGTFVEVMRKDNQRKLCLAFMVQSICSKFKDVVCLIPVLKLESSKLQYWFDKVLEALQDLFSMMAVSVDNHVCNR